MMDEGEEEIPPFFSFGFGFGFGFDFVADGELQQVRKEFIH